MQPTDTDLHVDALLTGISIGYNNPEYIADTIFPILPVLKESDLIPAYTQSFWFRDEARLRAPGTKSERGGWTVDNTARYFCDRYSYGHEISDQQRANADPAYSNLDRDATFFVTDKLQMRREVSFSTDFFKTSVWGTDKTGGTDFTQYSDYANSTPLVDFSADRDTMEGLIGREPNTFVMGKQMWTQLKWHPDFIDSIKYTQRGQLTVDLFAGLTEFERVLIGKSIYTTSPEGTAEASVSYTRIWGKAGLMLYVPAAPSMLNPAAGYTFVWQAVQGALQYMKRMRNEEREVDIVEANSFFDQKLTAKNAGLFLATAVA